MPVNATKLWNCSRKKKKNFGNKKNNTQTVWYQLKNYSISEKKTALGRSKALRFAATLMDGVFSWKQKIGKVLTDSDSQGKKENESGHILRDYWLMSEERRVLKHTRRLSFSRGAVHTLCKHEEIGSLTGDRISPAAHLTPQTADWR